MYARVELTYRPEYSDPKANDLLRQIEVTDPYLRKKIRYIRVLDVYWMDLPLKREEWILALPTILWDPVTQWLLTGNIIPSAAGTRGTLEDLLETAPNRPGNFYGLEKRFRLSSFDPKASHLLMALNTFLKRKLEPARILSGELMVIEGVGINEDSLARIARDYFSNPALESFATLSAQELQSSDRFHPERVKREIPKAPMLRAMESFEVLTEKTELFWKKRSLRLPVQAAEAIDQYYQTTKKRNPTNLESEIIGRIWEKFRARRWIDAPFTYTDSVKSENIPPKLEHLIRSTLNQTASSFPKPWLLSAFSNKPNLMVFDEEDCISVHHVIESESVACDPFYGVIQGLSKAYLYASTAGLGAKPVASSNALFLPDLLTPPVAMSNGENQVLHPRRILKGIKEGLSRISYDLSTPVLQGSLNLDAKSNETPVVLLSACSMLQRNQHNIGVDVHEPKVGQLLVYVGLPVSREGLPGQPPVGIPDVHFLAKLQDYIRECRELGWIEGLLDVREGGLSFSLYRACLITKGGVDVQGDTLPTRSSIYRYPDVFSAEGVERVLLFVDPNAYEKLRDLAQFRGIPIQSIGSVIADPVFRVRQGHQIAAEIDVAWLKQVPWKETHEAYWEPPGSRGFREVGDIGREGIEVLLRLLSSPNISSREWLIQSLGQDEQASAVVRPLQTSVYGVSPNDGTVFKPKGSGYGGVVWSSGFQSRLFNLDPFLGGIAAVDEAIRNSVALGADFGREDVLFGLSYLLAWPSEGVGEPKLAGQLIRACYGMAEAAQAFEVPFVSGLADAYPGTKAGQAKCVVQAISKITRVGGARSAEFKTPGDQIYLLGPGQMSLRGSCIEEMLGLPADASDVVYDLSLAKRLYQWFGGVFGKEQKKLRSIHDISDGGLLVALSEGLFARGVGANLGYPDGMSRTLEWEFLFGEGLHSFLVSCSEIDAALLEAEWHQFELPFAKLGQVLAQPVLQVKRGDQNMLVVETKLLRQAWKKEGYWQ